MIKRICPICNKEFDPKDRKDYTQTCCSKSCSAKFFRGKKPRTCIICSNEYFNSHKKSKYCSQACKNKDKNAHSKLSKLFNKQIELVCPCCGISFKIKQYRLNRTNKTPLENQKPKRGNFCSMECYNKSLGNKRIEVQCKRCGKVEKVNEAKSKTYSYCSRSCMNNEWSMSYFHELLKQIAVNGKVPRYTEMKSKYKKPFCRCVKGRKYLDIVRSIGLNINNGYRASDGHTLSSYYEWLFDEYLFLNNIPHETDGYIVSSSRCRYDFKINNVYIEIWGISQEASKYYNNYMERRRRKEKLYLDNNLKLISIDGLDFIRLSSTELQSLFKTKLQEFDIISQDNQTNYPVFNGRKIDYWNDKTIATEIENIIKSLGEFPTAKQLLKLNLSSLSGAIITHGGYRKFANLLGYKSQTKKYSLEYVIESIKEIKNQVGHFPHDRELQEMNKSDLSGLIKRHGGYGYFKELIEGARDKKPFGYWNDEDNIIKELKFIIAKLNRFPKYQELGPLAKGIDKSRKGINYYKTLFNESENT